MLGIRTRYIKRGEPRRVFIRASRCEEGVKLKEFLESQGLEAVGLLGYLKHLIFWRKGRKDD